MRSRVFLVIGLLCAVASIASSAVSPDTIVYAPPETWVLPVPAVVASSSSADAAVKFMYLDNQVHLDRDGTEEDFTAYRVKIQKPEGLTVGNVTLTWQPSNGPLTVHYVRLIHDSHTADVLASTKFTILQREEQLERSMLTGQRTATLQVPGVQVGDDLEVAVTIRRRQAVFGGRNSGLLQLPLAGMPGVFRAHLIWPRDRALALQGSKDLPPPHPIASGSDNVLDVTLRDPSGPVPTEGAPLRFNIRRLIEYSDFGAWTDVSRLMAPLFERAAAIAPGSSLKAEAAAIAVRTSAPVERAQAALQLVEERIRYVYVGLDGGDYVPASADETWTRRFGDCKAKAALLVALLRELGIEAEAALVNSTGGDGMDQRLPGPRAFDHVIVRAKIAGRVRWLDGTRLGDRYLDNLPSPFRWALPLTVGGADLEAIAPHDTGFPVFTGIVDIDARTGTDQDARVTMQNIIRGDEAFALRMQLSALAVDDADRAVKTYWRQQVGWVTPDKVGWRYDERRMALILDLIGRGNPGWKGDGTKGHSLTIPGAGFYAPDPMRRPSDQDQTANWAVEFPRFRCWATTIRLPKPTGAFAWSVYADPMFQRLGGTTYWRRSALREGVARTVMSRQNYEPEATPQEAALLNRAIPQFNYNMSNVAEVPSENVLTASLDPPFDEAIDWLNAPIPCMTR